MIKYTRTILPNGLTVLCNMDRSTPFVSVNILYKAGSRNETEERTGFAHLFEHLMFGGSANVEDFDREVQIAGGESNAFTTNDYTNYYITIPADNIETALWLESDRMLHLNLTDKALEVQKNVVVEEFKQRYLNAPYGDVWLKLRPLIYEVHPYRWPTIGKSTEHIERATREDVQEFFNRFYAPDNAIVSISGNIEPDRAVALVERWFGSIPAANVPKRVIPAEPVQTKARRMVLENNRVPADAIYKVFRMGSRISDDFYACDIISDVLSNGQSSRLYVNLIKNSRLFSGIDAYVTGDTDPGLFVFCGKLSEGASFEDAESAIDLEIKKFTSEGVSDYELKKVINKAEARICYSEISYQSKAGNLAFFEFLGNAELVNNECERYESVSQDTIRQTAEQLFDERNSSTLWYKKSDGKSELSPKSR